MRTRRCIQRREQYNFPDKKKRAVVCLRLQSPADPATPGVPDLLVLVPGAAGSGDLIADWARARRATGYRVKIQVAGEPEPRLFGLFADDQATLHGLPLGALLTVTVIAHNEAGDSAESTPATITLS